MKANKNGNDLIGNTDEDELSQLRPKYRLNKLMKQI